MWVDREGSEDSLNPVMDRHRFCSQWPISLVKKWWPTDIPFLVHLLHLFLPLIAPFPNAAVSDTDIKDQIQLVRSDAVHLRQIILVLREFQGLKCALGCLASPGMSRCGENRFVALLNRCRLFCLQSSQTDIVQACQLRGELETIRDGF